MSSHHIHATEQLRLSEGTTIFVNFCRVDGSSIQKKATNEELTDVANTEKQG
jgi:hypothetical protein